MAIRMSQRDAPDVLPVFPLPGALLLPRGRLPLNIFEPRYLAMIDDCLRSEHRLIGMIQPRSCQAEATPRLYDVGCAGRLTMFSETPDGRYLIALSGVARFRVSHEEEGFTPYRRLRVDWSPFARDFGGNEKDHEFDRDAFLAKVERYFRVKSLDTDWEALKAADPEAIINALAMLCPFTPQEKQALLETVGLGERREALGVLLDMGSAEPGGASGNLQ